MTSVLQQLRSRYAYTHLISSEEAGPRWSYARDRAVARWCRSQGVEWTEFAQAGVVRRLRTCTGNLYSPLTAADGCSRLSADLAFGTLSMRSVHQATEARMASTANPAWAFGLRGFASRLRWHCHFMQKLEDGPKSNGARWRVQLTAAGSSQGKTLRPAAYGTSPG
jgi:deoxyribodipyrimidine photolyase